MIMLMLQNIFLIVAVVLNLLLAAFVYAKNRNSATHQLFVGLVISLVGFLLINYMSLHPAILSQLMWIRLDLFAASYMFLLSYITFIVFPGAHFIKPSPFRRSVGIYTVVVSFLTLTPLVFSSLDTSGGGTNPVPGPGIILFAIQQVGLLILIFLTLRHRLKNARGREREQFKYIIFGLIATFGSIIFFNLVMVQVFKITSLVFVSNISSIFFTGAFTYAIVKQRLFDIRLIVARSVTYLLSIITIGVAYGLLAFSLVDQLLFGSGTSSSVTQNTVNTMLAVALAFTFQPIRRFFEKVTDRIFYRDKYDAQLLINTIGRILASEIELESLTTKVVREIKKEMRIEHADIIVVQGEQEHIFFDAGHLQNRVAIHHRDLAKLGSSIVVADNLASGERKEIMRNYNRSVASPLRANKELIGYLFLGDKLSGDAYSNGDIEVIKIIVNELAVAVQNAKSYTEIQRFNETLQDKVTEATRKLRKANEDLKTLDQAKDEFISMASHQLRTPLTTAKGYVSMVLDGDFGKMPTKMRPPLEQALDSSNRMSGLINDLLNVSRMDAGKFFIDAVDVDLALEVQGEVNQLANLSQAKNVTLTYHPPKKKIPLIKLDLDKTRQVIMNIADNAVHYSAPPSGGGKADVYLDLEGDEAVFRVVDNGIGVPDDIKPKLFAKFFRAGNAQQARPDGTGLGLYLVKRVVEDQGGTIIFESEVGKGSTFGFRMPIHNKLKIDKEAAKRLGNIQGGAAPAPTAPPAEPVEAPKEESKAKE